MLKLLSHLRALNLYSHHAHNLCGRIPFFQDHEFLNEVYEKADDDYDSVIERIIGTKGDQGLDLISICQASCQKLASIPMGTQNSDMFQAILQMKLELISMIEFEIKQPGVSQGTIQMLGDISDKEEVHIYKIKQRLRK
jgi:DNA-binding ferritin-like protein